MQQKGYSDTPNEIVEKESWFLRANSLSNFFFFNIFHSRWMLIEKGNHQGGEGNWWTKARCKHDVLFHARIEAGYISLSRQVASEAQPWSSSDGFCG